MMQTPNTLLGLHLQHATEGMNAATDALVCMALTNDTAIRTDILADAMGNLIDVPLGFNNLESTQARLRGFAKILAEKFAYRTQSGFPVMQKDLL